MFSKNEDEKCVKVEDVKCVNVEDDTRPTFERFSSNCASEYSSNIFRMQQLYY